MRLRENHTEFKWAYFRKEMIGLKYNLAHLQKDANGFDTDGMLIKPAPVVVES